MYEPPSAGSGYTVHWTLESDALKMAVVADRTAGWISVGFSSDGSMVGSDAVIGMAGSVKLYELQGKSTSDVVESSKAISATSIAFADGKVTMQFERPVADLSDGSGRRLAAFDPNADTILLTGYASSSTLSIHDTRSAFTREALRCRGRRPHPSYRLPPVPSWHPHACQLGSAPAHRCDHGSHQTPRW